MQYLVFAGTEETYDKVLGIFKAARIPIVTELKFIRSICIDDPTKAVLREIEKFGGIVVKDHDIATSETPGSSTGGPQLFLCHSSKDKSFVRKLARDLAQLSVYAWFDEWELTPGDSLHDRIGHALEESAFVGVVLSPNSIRSKWCSKELNQALSRETRTGEKVVIPVRFRNCPIPAFLEDKLYLDFSKSYLAAITQLAAMVHSLKQRLVAGAIGEAAPKSLEHVKQILTKPQTSDLFSVFQHRALGAI